MAEATALIVCDSVAHDPNTGKVTLYGVLDKITIRELPSAIANLAIYWRCAGMNGGEISLTILKPDETTLFATEPMKIETTEHTVHGTLSVSGLAFETLGEYVVMLRHSSKILLRTQIVVTRTPEIPK